MISKSEQEIMSSWEKKYNGKPMVGIQCIVYNHEKYIEQCLDGFLMQITTFPFIIVVHDDCSTDKSASIIHKYELEYPNIIKALYENENQYSKGSDVIFSIMNPYLDMEFIAVCEGDDYWIDQYKLQKQYDYMISHPECGLCFTNFNFYYQSTGVFENEVLTYQSAKYNSEYTLEDWIYKASYTGPMTWFYRNEIFKKYTEIKTPDRTFVLFAHFLACSSVHCMKNDITGVYRILDESAAHSKDLRKTYLRNKKLYYVQLNLIDKYNLSDEFKQSVTLQYYTKTYKQIGMMNDQEERLKALKYNHSLIPKLFLWLSKNKVFRLITNKIWSKKYS